MSIRTIKLNSFSNLTQTSNHIHVGFTSSQRVMSSATLNGGFVKADHILNLKVPINSESKERPEQSLQDYADTEGWLGCTVGMMTAAPMTTLRIAHAQRDGIDVTVLVTTGLANARRAGDKADVQDMLLSTSKVGTINLTLVCSAKLSEAAMVEAVMIATEAKVAALQDAKVMSPISQKPATGTGTDSTVVVSGEGPEEITYCGKHVLLGELIGHLTIQAVTESLTKS